ncbi:MAG TPA: efflux RND transporter periplasmic adaptor subunit [Xanthobacteraceae bacterium]|nr:efflux RND transporter periplasmic adaptor subunit [Xanthobacteraceae bacterium]
MKILTILALVLALTGCGRSASDRFQGYVEGDLIFVGSDEMGRVETLAVREGDRVSVGQPIFSVDRELQVADVASAEATLTNARATFDRAVSLLKTAAGTQKAVDDAQAALREAEARLVSARTRLARRQVASPVEGPVQQVYYRPGELVPAGRPIVSILPPGNVKVRFFVPEALLPRLSPGGAVAVSCDGCREPITARISFIARTAEYTPPVIYSLEERAKLVFLVEARPERPDSLRVGQPVSVALEQK